MVTITLLSGQLDIDMERDDYFEAFYEVLWIIFVLFC